MARLGDTQRAPARGTTKSTAVRWPSRARAASSRRCLRPRAVGESGNSARLPESSDAALTSISSGRWRWRTRRSKRLRPRVTSRPTSLAPRRAGNAPRWMAPAATALASDGTTHTHPRVALTRRSVKAVRRPRLSASATGSRRAWVPGFRSPVSRPVSRQAAVTSAPPSSRRSTRNLVRRATTVAGTSEANATSREGGAWGGGNGRGAPATMFARATPRPAGKVGYPLAVEGPAKGG
jgi:hypothetical protein